MTRPFAAALAVTALLLAGCGNSDDPTIAAPTPTLTVLSTPEPTPSATSILPAGVDQVVSFTIKDRVVSGPDGRVKVVLGTVLRIVITSDVADEVHLHGYDKRVDVEAGGTATLTVKATIPGVFAVELEASHLEITSLQVQ